jgi:tRNA A-37 threonylcarbamoyl transferase component Bud32
VSAAGRFCSNCGASIATVETPTVNVDSPEGVRPDVRPSGHISPSTSSIGGRFAVGAVIAQRYAITKLLGRGAMGEVYCAQDMSLRQPVALKFLPEQLSRDPEFMKRVREEVRLSRKVSHPNVCRVHDIGETGGQPFISMEYIGGEDMASLLRRIGRLPAEKALEIARQICAGLAAAHAAGVLHRDLKPANVMFDHDGRAHITDFGVAIAREAAGKDEIAGTPAYMAPEQFAGREATERSDLFGLGAVLYELFTGKRPFGGATLAEIRRLLRETDAMPPAQIARDIDPDVERVILQCLAREPEQRPSSALAVLAALSGGDPMAAALAAGQTPSPQMVAASSVRGALRPATAWACAALVLVSIGIFHTFGARSSLVEHAAPPLPPAALAAKAREALKDLSIGNQWKGEAYGFDYDHDAIRFAGMPGKETRTGDARSAAEKKFIEFWYRASLDYLVPRDHLSPVTREDPPLGAGDATVVLDTSGRLLRLTALPGPGASMDTVKREPDQGTLLRLGGLDPTRLEATVPRGARAPFEDSRLAWRGSMPEHPDLDVFVEAAFYAGRPVFFRVFAPWTSDPVPVKPRRAFSPVDAYDIFIITMLLAAIPLARHNLRQGRGDRRGAWRLAVFAFLCRVTSALLTAHHVPVFAVESATIIAVVARSLWFGGTTWLLYIALEPLVRRTWPEMLVSWTRLLSGAARDSLVARDILLSTAITSSLAAAVIALAALARPGSIAAVEPSLAPLLGFSQCFASTALALNNGVRFGLVALLLFLLLRRLRRLRGVAPACVGIVLAVIAYTSLVDDIATVNSIALLMALSVGASILLLVRLGQLALVLALFLDIVVGLLFPGTTRLTGWYAGCTWWVTITLAFLTGYGVYYSTGGRPFGEGALFKD